MRSIVSFHFQESRVLPSYSLLQIPNIILIPALEERRIPHARLADEVPEADLPGFHRPVVADVDDAMVSNRVYKENMTFEKADAIIREGMGSQFDPALEPVYLAARPKLEAYYSSLE